ncbi:MAG TPA: hypothetical protein VGL93_12740 [Streptosporangiaceae bacterium]
MAERFWQHEPDAPFATMLSLIETYCHPEAYDEAYEDFQAAVALPAHDPIFDRFKNELRQAIQDPGSVPPGAIDRAAQYDDGSAAKFLARLWHDLYPDEPLPTA